MSENVRLATVEQKAAAFAAMNKHFHWLTFLEAAALLWLYPNNNLKWGKKNYFIVVVNDVLFSSKTLIAVIHLLPLPVCLIYLIYFEGWKV